MVYRLFVETSPAKDGTDWAFMIFNHQDFTVYKRRGKSDSKDTNRVTLEVAETALAYFSNFMRRRYYDEHFATILDEDSITLFTEYPLIEECWKNKTYEKGFTGENAALWQAMIPYFTRPSMQFKTHGDETLAAQTRALLK